MTTLFISDLHLSEERPDKIELFRTLLAESAGKVDAVYILGDLYEVFLGDDDDTPPNQNIVNALQQVSSKGTPLYVMRGNRDFLMGKQFEEMTGCQLLADPTVIELYGVPTLLMHGDILCTKDVEYQNFRATVQDPNWQSTILAKPLAERRAIAGRIRSDSNNAKLGKAEVIMDVDADAVDAVMREHQLHTLIHGHTHRAAVHDFELDGAAARRVVLGDWYEEEWIFACDPQSQRLLRTDNYLGSL